MIRNLYEKTNRNRIKTDLSIRIRTSPSNILPSTNHLGQSSHSNCSKTRLHIFKPKPKMKLVMDYISNQPTKSKVQNITYTD